MPEMTSDFVRKHASLASTFIDTPGAHGETEELLMEQLAMFRHRAWAELRSVSKYAATLVTALPQPTPKLVGTSTVEQLHARAINVPRSSLQNALNDSCTHLVLLPAVTTSTRRTWLIAPPSGHTAVATPFADVHNEPAKGKEEGYQSHEKLHDD